MRLLGHFLVDQTIDLDLVLVCLRESLLEAAEKRLHLADQRAAAVGRHALLQPVQRRVEFLHFRLDLGAELLLGLADHHCRVHTQQHAVLARRLRQDRDIAVTAPRRIGNDRVEVADDLLGLWEEMFLHQTVVFRLGSTHSGEHGHVFAVGLGDFRHLGAVFGTNDDRARLVELLLQLRHERFDRLDVLFRSRVGVFPYFHPHFEEVCLDPRTDGRFFDSIRIGANARRHTGEAEVTVRCDDREDRQHQSEPDQDLDPDRQVRYQPRSARRAAGQLRLRLENHGLYPIQSVEKRISIKSKPLTSPPVPGKFRWFGN